MNSDILDIRNVTKRYSGFTLDRVNLSVASGSILGLIGENGAGKSTTINAILGLISRDGGEVLFRGKPLDGEDRRAKEEIGIVCDDVGFYPTLTPPKIGVILRAAYSKWDEPYYRRFLGRFGIPEDKEIRHLSKGMKMKLMIGAALAHHPSLLILDEATSGLDPVVRDEMLDLFLDFVQDERHAILLSSHITADLEKIADAITFLHEGKVVFSLPKDELLNRYGIVRCTGTQFDEIGAGEALVCRRQDYEWQALVPDRRHFAHLHPGFLIDPPSIDEVMLLYIKGQKAR